MDELPEYITDEVIRSTDSYKNLEVLARHFPDEESASSYSALMMEIAEQNELATELATVALMDKNEVEQRVAVIITSMRAQELHDLGPQDQGQPWRGVTLLEDRFKMMALRRQLSRMIKRLESGGDAELPEDAIEKGSEYFGRTIEIKQDGRLEKRK